MWNEWKNGIKKTLLVGAVVMSGLVGKEAYAEPKGVEVTVTPGTYALRGGSLPSEERTAKVGLDDNVSLLFYAEVVRYINQNNTLDHPFSQAQNPSLGYIGNDFNNFRYVGAGAGLEVKLYEGIAAFVKGGVVEVPQSPQAPETWADSGMAHSKLAPSVSGGLNIPLYHGEKIKVNFKPVVNYNPFGGISGMSGLEFRF
ncbi:MAG: hypothetical protein WCV90_00775 [Candidatus Woesearchaeota archaeon]|jgi:hypothetical protein